MFKPEFPYKGDQAIISSGRVTIHSKDDFIFLFGKKSVSISSPATFTVDANEKTIIASPIIELGLRARLEGDPVMLGDKTAAQLGQLIDTLVSLANGLSALNESNLSGAIPQIVASAKILSEVAPIIKAQLQTTCQSKITFTK
jgi:hypothetical protein